MSSAFAGRIIGPFLAWVGAVTVVSAVAGTAYLAAQHTGRVGADDVPRALASRLAQMLSEGMSPVVVASGPSVSLSSDSTAFAIVYDASHRVLATTATLSGGTPEVPAGVLDAATATGEDHVTWQPMSGVREAVVARPWHTATDSGVVVAGAGLGPTEARANAVLVTTAIAWLCAVALATILLAFVSRYAARRGKNREGLT